MTDENKIKFEAMVERVNGMSDADLAKLILDDKCPYEPEHLLGVPMGMFHCPVCGDMVVAGMKHGKSLNEDDNPKDNHG